MDTRLETFQVGWKLGEGAAFGLHMGYFVLPAQSVTRENPGALDPRLRFSETGRFAPSDFRGEATYALTLGDGARMGASLRGISQDIQGGAARNLLLDLGLQHRVGEHWGVGVSAQNLGLPAKIGSEGFDPPRHLRAGLEYRRDGLLALAELGLPQANVPGAGLGLEWTVGGRYFPRLGWRYDGVFNPWSFGVGLGMGGLRLDLAGVQTGEMGLAYQGSLNYDFGPRREKPRPKDAARPADQLIKVVPHANSAVPSQPNHVYVPLQLDFKPDWGAEGMYWRLEIVEPGGAVFHFMEGQSGAEAEKQVWDGRNARGESFTSNQIYSFRLKVFDGTGAVFQDQVFLSRVCVFRQ